MGFSIFGWKVGSTPARDPSLSTPSSSSYDHSVEGDAPYPALVAPTPPKLRNKASSSSLLANPFRAILSSPSPVRRRSSSIDSSTTTTTNAQSARPTEFGSRVRGNETQETLVPPPAVSGIKSNFFGIRGTMSTTSLVLQGEKKKRWGGLGGSGGKRRISLFGSKDEGGKVKERAVKDEGDGSGFVVRSFRTVSRVYEDPIAVTGPYESLPYAASSPSLPLSSPTEAIAMSPPRRPALNVRSLGPHGSRESGRSSPTISVEAFHAASARSRSTTSLSSFAELSSSTSTPSSTPIASRFSPAPPSGRRPAPNPPSAAPLSPPRRSSLYMESPYGDAPRGEMSASSCLSISTFATASEGGHGSRRNSTFETPDSRRASMRPSSGIGWDDTAFGGEGRKIPPPAPPLPIKSAGRVPCSNSTMPIKRSNMAPTVPYLASRSTPSLSLQPASPFFPPTRAAGSTPDPASWESPSTRPATRPRVSFNDRPLSSVAKGKSVAVSPDSSGDEDDVPLARLSQIRSASTSDLSLRPRSTASFVPRPALVRPAAEEKEVLIRERTPPTTRRSMSTFSFATHTTDSSTTTNPLPPPSHSVRSYSSPSSPVASTFPPLSSSSPPSLPNPSAIPALDSDPQRNSSSSSSGSGSGSSLPQTPKDQSPGASILGSGMKAVSVAPSIVGGTRDGYGYGGSSLGTGGRRIGSMLAPPSERGSVMTSKGREEKGNSGETVYGRMKERHKKETRKGIEIGRDLNGPGQMRDPELEDQGQDDEDDDEPLASLPSRSQLGVPGILKHSTSHSQLSNSNSNASSSLPQQQSFPPASPFAQRPPSTNYAHLSQAPPGVDPYLYASLPPDQRLSLHARAAQMMQLMAQAAMQAKADSQAGWETGSNTSRGSVGSNASGGPGMYGGGPPSGGMYGNGMGMMGMPPMGMGMGMGGQLPPNGAYAYGGYGAMPPGSRLPPFAPSRATSQPFFQPPPLLPFGPMGMGMYPQSSMAFMGQAPPPAPSSIGTSTRIANSEMGGSGRPVRESRRSFSSGTSLVGARR